MRTTVDLPDALFRKVKAISVLRGLKMKEFIVQALSRAILENGEPVLPESAEIPRVTANELARYPDGDAIQAAFPNGYRLAGPLIPKKKGSERPALSNAEIQAVLDQEDLDRYGKAG